jgi:hypothetical protein
VKKLKRDIRRLEKQVLYLYAFAEVALPVVEKQYKKKSA